MPTAEQEQQEQLQRALTALDPDVLRQLVEGASAKEVGTGTLRFSSQETPEVPQLELLERAAGALSEVIKAAPRDEAGNITDKKIRELMSGIQRISAGILEIEEGKVVDYKGKDRASGKRKKAGKMYQELLQDAGLDAMVRAGYLVRSEMGEGEPIVRWLGLGSLKADFQRGWDRKLGGNDGLDELWLATVESLERCHPREIMTKAVRGGFRETLATLAGPVLAFAVAERQALKEVKERLANGQDIFDSELVERALKIDVKSELDGRGEVEGQIAAYLQHQPADIREQVQRLRRLSPKRRRRDYLKAEEETSEQAKAVYKSTLSIQKGLLGKFKRDLKAKKEFQWQVFGAAGQSKRPSGHLLWDLALGKPASEVLGRGSNREIPWQAWSGELLKALVENEFKNGSGFRQTMEDLIIGPYKALVYSPERGRVLRGRLEKTLDIKVGDVLSDDDVKMLMALWGTRSEDEIIAAMAGFDAAGPQAEFLEYGRKKGWYKEVEAAFNEAFPRDATKKDKGLPRAVTEAMAINFRRAEQTNEAEKEKLMVYNLAFGDPELRQEFADMMAEIDPSKFTDEQKTVLFSLLAGGFSETDFDHPAIENHYGQIMVEKGVPLLVAAARDRSETDRQKTAQAKLTENILKGAVKYGPWEVAKGVLDGFASSMQATPLELGEYTGLLYDCFERLNLKDETVPAEVRRKAKWQLASYLANVTEGIAPNTLSLIETWSAQAKELEALKELDPDEYAKKSRKSVLQRIIDLNSLIGDGPTLLPSAFVVDTLSLNPIPSELRLEALKNDGKDRPHFKPEVAYLQLGGEFAPYGKQEPTAELVAVTLAANIANKALAILRTQRKADQEAMIETETAREGMSETTAIQSTDEGRVVVERTFSDQGASFRDMDEEKRREAMTGRAARQEVLVVAEPEVRERRRRTRAMTGKELQIGEFLGALLEKAGLSGRLIPNPQKKEETVGMESSFALGLGYRPERHGISKEALVKVGGRYLWDRQAGALVRQVGEDFEGDNWGEYAVENPKSPSLAQIVEDARRIKETRQKIEEEGWMPEEAARFVWGEERVRQLKAGE